MPFSGIHDEDMKHNADLMKELEAIVVGLERAPRHAEYMRRDMVERLKDVAESRDFWDREAADKLTQLERYKSVLEMWRKGIPVCIPQVDDSPMADRCHECNGHGTVSDDCSEDMCYECDGTGLV